MNTLVCFASRRLAAGLAVLALCWPLVASADCVDTRKPTAAELEFFRRGQAAVLAALPPLPVGAVLQYKDSEPSIGMPCAGGAIGDFSMEATRAYELNFRKSIVSVRINVRQLPRADPVLVGAYGQASPKRSAGLRVTNVVWEVSGSDSPLRQALADAIDRTRLEALVGNPLPSVAESQALAAQAVPATVAAAPARAAPAPNVPPPQTATTQAATTQAATQPAAAPNPAVPAAPGTQPAAMPINEVVDTVNRLRGLFGR